MFGAGFGGGDEFAGQVEGAGLGAGAGMAVGGGFEEVRQWAWREVGSRR